MSTLADMLDKIKGCMVGGAVGDALGYAVEFKRENEIFSLFGEKGITEYVLKGNKAIISDDTQMTMFTAEGMLFAEKKYKNPTTFEYVACVYHSYLNWLSTQGEIYILPKNIRKSILLGIKELYATRHPGVTCITALQSGVCGTYGEKLNDSKGCGGVMRIAPVALLLSQKNLPKTFIGDVAARCAAITHSHDLGYIPAAFLALLIEGFLKEGYTDSSVKNALAETTALFHDSSYLNYFYSLIDAAMSLAKNAGKSDLQAIRELGEGWVAEETVAIALYCTLRHKDNFEQAIIASVNHSGDSDSTGAVTGNLMGALLGYSAIPEKFLGSLELKDALLALSQDLLIEN